MQEFHMDGAAAEAIWRGKKEKKGCASVRVHMRPKKKGGMVIFSTMLSPLLVNVFWGLSGESN